MARLQLLDGLGGDAGEHHSELRADLRVVAFARPRFEVVEVVLGQLGERRLRTADDIKLG